MLAFLQVNIYLTKLGRLVHTVTKCFCMMKEYIIDIF